MRHVTSHPPRGTRGIGPWLRMFLPVFAVQFAILGACVIYLVAFHDPAGVTRPGKPERVVSAPHRTAARADAAKPVPARMTLARRSTARKPETRHAPPASRSA